METKKTTNQIDELVKAYELDVPPKECPKCGKTFYKRTPKCYDCLLEECEDNKNK